MISKRIFDIVGAGLGILMLSPIFLIISALIFFSSGMPILFRQQRIGVNDKEFELIKFCTMTHEVDKDGAFLDDQHRITKLGAFLRRSSLDELPELFNVLCGEMSLVGPRPLLVEYLPRYTAEQRQRHKVKPGITGWAQINGRNGISWEEKFKFDVWYVNNHNLLIDIEVIMKTLLIVLKQENISAPNHATSAPFMGTKTEE